MAPTYVVPGLLCVGEEGDCALGDPSPLHANIGDRRHSSVHWGATHQQTGLLLQRLHHHAQGKTPNPPPQIPPHFLLNHHMT